MYRPQFVYPKAGPGCRDVACTYSFDVSNTPGLGNIPNNSTVNVKIPLILDQDADFFLRGIQTLSTVTFGNPFNVRLGLLDCFNNQILDPVLAGNPPTCYQYLWSQSAASPTGGGGIVTLDSDDWGIYCPAGGALGAYVQNTSTGVASVIINLYGIKRYRGEKCF